LKTAKVVAALTTPLTRISLSHVSQSIIFHQQPYSFEIMAGTGIEVMRGHQAGSIIKRKSKTAL